MLQETTFELFIKITLQTEIIEISNANHHALRTKPAHETAVILQSINQDHLAHLGVPCTKLFQID